MHVIDFLLLFYMTVIGASSFTFIGFVVNFLFVLYIPVIVVFIYLIYHFLRHCCCCKRQSQAIVAGQYSQNGVDNPHLVPECRPLLNLHAWQPQKLYWVTIICPRWPVFWSDGQSCWKIRRTTLPLSTTGRVHSYYMKTNLICTSADCNMQALLIDIVRTYFLLFDLMLCQEMIFHVIITNTAATYH